MQLKKTAAFRVVVAGKAQVLLITVMTTCRYYNVKPEMLLVALVFETWSLELHISPLVSPGLGSNALK